MSSFPLFREDERSSTAIVSSLGNRRDSRLAKQRDCVRAWCVDLRPDISRTRFAQPRPRLTEAVAYIDARLRFSPPIGFGENAVIGAAVRTGDTFTEAEPVTSNHGGAYMNPAGPTRGSV